MSFFKFICPEAQSDLQEFEKIIEEIASIESRLLEESQRERKVLVDNCDYSEIYDIPPSKFDIAKKTSSYNEEIEDIIYSYLKSSNEELLSIRYDLNRIENTVEYTGLSEPERMKELISGYASLIDEVEEFEKSIN